MYLGCRAVPLKVDKDKESSSSDDLYLSHGFSEILPVPRIKSKNTHGTGALY